MIIIYNLSGLLWGFLGVIVGAAATLVSRHLWLGLLVMAAVWFSFGWRKTDKTTGLKLASPSVFFIPLRIWAAPVALLAIFAFWGERTAGTSKPDPRAALLSADERVLRGSTISGDQALSQSLRKALTATNASEDCSVFTRVGPDAVLVLVEIANLRKLKADARADMLNTIAQTLTATSRLNGKAAYVGIKGPLLYGAIRVPGATGISLPKESILYDFYGSAVAQADPVAPEHPVMTRPSTQAKER